MPGGIPEYQPYFRAEDHFKIICFQTNRYWTTNKRCLWNKDSNPSILPKKWSKNAFTQAEDKIYRARKVYYDHLALLERCFEDPSSPFKVQVTQSMGLAVFAKHPIKMADFNRNKDGMQDLLCGFMTPSLLREESHSQVLFKVRKRGVKKGCENHMVEEFRNLYGPMSFLNHACHEHAHFVISQRGGGARTGAPFLKMKNDATRAGQLFVDYNMPASECPKCKKRK